MSTNRIAALVVSLTALASVDARAENATNPDTLISKSCAFWSRWNADPKVPANQKPVAQCWDFETGQLGDDTWGRWTVAGGTAFNNQPTYGDNIRTARVHQSGPLRNGLNRIGGDYWNGPHPIGHQGQFWLGTFENRRRPSQPWGQTQGDTPTGRILSKSFTVDRAFITFLIGGDCKQGFIAVNVYDDVKKTWSQAVHAKTGAELKARGNCSELMERKYFDTREAGLTGRTIRMEINDNNTGGWGHVNVDHIVHTDTDPKVNGDLGGANQPVWGLAETHAHPVNDQTSKSLGGNREDGQVLWGPGPFMGEADGISLVPCSGHHHNVVTQGGITFLNALEQDSLGGKAASRHTDRRGAPTYTGWPAWWSRIHQKMSASMMKRAYEGGMRLMVASVGNAELMGWAVGRTMKQFTPFLSDHGAINRSISALRMTATVNSGWMGIASTPAEARRLIRENKMAVVIGLELDTVGAACNQPFIGGPPEMGTVRSQGIALNVYAIDRSGLGECADDRNWELHLDTLYKMGVRHIIPIHLTDNNLGGSAVYSDLFNMNNRFVRGRYYDIETVDPSVDFTFKKTQARPLWCETGIACQGIQMPPEAALYPFSKRFWEFWLSILAPDVTTPALGTDVVNEYAVRYDTNYNGHTNERGLSPQGREFVEQMMARGMIVDIEHASQKVKDAILGLRDYATAPVIARPGCTDLNSQACQERAYPLIASHGGPRAMAWTNQETSIMGKRPNENQLRDDQLARISAIGGMVGVGTGSGDVRNYTTGGATETLYAATTPNDCAGSTKTFAQAYLYSLRRMNGRSVSIGTDINGFNGEANPRFGRDGCYARGGLTGPHENTDWRLIATLGRPGIGAQQRWRQVTTTRLTRYTGEAANQQRNVPHTNYLRPEDTCFTNRGVAIDQYGNETAEMSCGGRGLTMPVATSSLPAISRYDPPGTERVWNINVDGLAHYGMLPDFFQDLRTVGVTTEQLGPLFNSAEAYIRMWEKACRLADTAKSAIGCK